MVFYEDDPYLDDELIEERQLNYFIFGLILTIICLFGILIYFKIEIEDYRSKIKQLDSKLSLCPTRSVEIISQGDNQAGSLLQFELIDEEKEPIASNTNLEEIPVSVYLVGIKDMRQDIDISLESHLKEMLPLQLAYLKRDDAVSLYTKAHSPYDNVNLNENEFYMVIQGLKTDLLGIYTDDEVTLTIIEKQKQELIPYLEK